MKERPIPFYQWEIRPALDRRKTQFRRLANPQPDWINEVQSTIYGSGPFIWPIGALGQQCGSPINKFPYGQPGDRLWVQEAYHLWQPPEAKEPIAQR